MKRFAPAAFVAIVAIITFANSLGNAFAFDDEFIVSGNLRVHQLADQASIWLTPYWPQFGDGPGLYRPLAIFGYAVQWALGGGAPWLYHFVNIVLHVACSLLVLALLRRLVSPVASLLGALLFAVHPVHTEAVANIVGQAELLATAAVLAACVVHVSRPPGARTAWWRRIAIMVLFALGLLAKEGAVVLPALLIALDVSQRRFTFDRPGWFGWLRATSVQLIGLGVILAGWATLRIFVLGSFAGSAVAPSLPFLEDGRRIPTALSVWPEYARLLIVPLDLSADYSPAVVTPASGATVEVLVGVILLCGTVLLAVGAHRRPIAGLAAAWFAITILPVSNLIVPIGVLLAERTLYLPSVALSIGMAALAEFVVSAGNARQRMGIAVAAAMVLVLFAARSMLRNPDWKDTRAYTLALVRDHPESYRAQWSMAAQMAVRGDSPRALEYMELSYRTWPEDARAVDELARLNIQAGNADRAIHLLEQQAATGRDAADATTVVLSYLAADRFADALAAAGRLVEGSRDASSLRAQALEGQGRHDAALESWERAVSGEQPSWAWLCMLARALARQGRTTDALAVVRRAGAAAPSGRNQLVDNLGLAIERGCYQSVNPMCDPLAGWRAVLASGPLRQNTPTGPAPTRVSVRPDHGPRPAGTR